MMTTFARLERADPQLAAAWGRAAAEAAMNVPATGNEAVSWTVRGWAEVALGCLAADLPDAARGLDEVVRASGVPVTGPFAGRLRTLRAMSGPLPACYLARDADLSPADPLPADVAAACEVIAEYCDSLADLAAATPPALRRAAERPLPAWTGITDHLRWGERFRPSPRIRGYSVRRARATTDLTRRSWMTVPAAAPRSQHAIILVSPLGLDTATVRQRIRQGIHNGAHLDHLTALDAEPPREPESGRADVSGAREQWRPRPIEFGAGLMVAESYAMSVELLAVAECLMAGRIAESEELRRGLVSRIGRIPGYRDWQAARGPGGARALEEATHDKVVEFATLPTLAGRYVAGPLALIAGDWIDPLLPKRLAALIRRRWASVCDRFEPAARLTERAQR